MKKLLVFLILSGLFLPEMGFAAHAMVLSIGDTGVYQDPPNAAIIRWNFNVVFEGGDVPGTFQKDTVSISVSSTTTPSQLSAAVVAAVQADATAKGFTVPAGSTLMPNYSAQ